MRDYPVIDLCLDMPMQADEYIQTLTNMCLDPNFRGYKSAYAPGIAGQIGLNIEELDQILEREGEEAWKKIVDDAARKNAMTPDKFVE